jgi:hypothetical protein
MTAKTIGPHDVLGADGKIYQRRPSTQEERDYLADRAHYLSHAENRSVRQIVAALLDEDGVRRSVGWVSGILRTWTCSKCSGATNEPT